jgi:hypothetical protein
LSEDDPKKDDAEVDTAFDMHTRTNEERSTLPEGEDSEKCCIIFSDGSIPRAIRATGSSLLDDNTPSLSSS